MTVEIVLSIPGKFSELKFWLDASDVNSVTKDSSNQVSQWNDKSGNDSHAVKSTSTNQPILVADSQNGLSTLQFDGK